MPDEKRVKEAQKNIALYQEEGLLWKIKSLKGDIKKTYERNYKESLDVATIATDINN